MENIKISVLDNSRIKDLINFSKFIHPGLDNIENRFDWFSFQNPFLKEKGCPLSLLALNQEQNIVGLFMLNNQDWHLNGSIHKGFIGYDLFVRKDYQKTGIGALLLIQAIRQYKPFFGLGLTKIAEKLYSLAKVKQIGSLDKFLWVNKPLSSMKHILRYSFKKNHKRGKRVQEKLFPRSLNIDGLTFGLLSYFPEEQYKSYYESQMIEFSRSPEFLKWRFFQSDIKYQFYYCRNHQYPLYFIVRNLMRKGLDLLSLVDYKFPISDEKAWRLILKLSKRIARDLQLDGVVTASSHSFLNRILREERFFAVGKPSPIVSTITGNESSIPEINKNSIYVTMADADIDLNFG